MSLKKIISVSRWAAAISVLIALATLGLAAQNNQEHKREHHIYKLTMMAGTFINAPREIAGRGLLSNGDIEGIVLIPCG